MVLKQQEKLVGIYSRARIYYFYQGLKPVTGVSALLLLLERFSFECRETKTKAITMTNHNKLKPHNEPMRTQIKYT